VSGFTFDTNIIIDALLDVEVAIAELEHAAAGGEPLWVSRMVWVEILSKGSPEEIRSAKNYLARFSTDELDEAHCVASAPDFARRTRSSSLRRNCGAAYW